MLTFSRMTRNIRSLRRYRQVLGVLIKYGFGHIVEQLNIQYLRRATPRVAMRNIGRLGGPVRLRLAMEELGPTFIKLGQLLSTRPDILPDDFIKELSKLQDTVPPVDTATIMGQIEQELGQPVAQLFAEISTEPLAAASIAQVHRGRLQSGEPVVVKVRRPGIGQIIRTDIDILMSLARLVERHLPKGEYYNPTGLVREFRRTISREMSFSREGHTIDRFRENFRNDPSVYIPMVYHDLCGETVLTMEYIDGIKVSDFDRLIAAGYDLKVIAENGANAVLKQVLVHGFFHGDPHPGNIFVLPNNTVCFLDYGMVGRLDRELKIRVAELLSSILDRDVDRMITELVYSGELIEDIRLPELRLALGNFIDDYYEIPLHEINAGKLLTELVELLVQYRIPFSPDLLLLAKALITIEGIGRRLDPEFNMVGHLKPFMARLMMEKSSPANLSREGAKLLRFSGKIPPTGSERIHQSDQPQQNQDRSGTPRS
jgi:ubiquinone biosynthesis protein